MAAAIDAGADDMRDDGDSWEVVSPPDAFQKVLDAVKALGIEPGRRRDRDAAAELRQARRQARAADGQADGDPRGPRRHARRSGRTPTSRRRRSRPRWRERSSGSIPARAAPATAASSGSAAATRSSSAASLSGPPRATFPEKLNAIHDGLTALLARHRPDCVAIEDIFHARNVRSALKLGHARGVALLAAVGGGPAGRRVRAGRRSSAPSSATAAPRSTRCSRWSSCCSASTTAPTPHDAADALAVAICHLHDVDRASSRTARRRATADVERRTSTVCGRWRALIARDRATCAARWSRSTRAASSSTSAASATTCRCRSRRSTGSASRARRWCCGSTPTCARMLIALYGFSTPLEQDLFERLIAISGIGPKLGAGGAVGHRAGGLDPRDPHAGRRAADGDSRRRQEDRRADRARAEGSAAATAAAGGRPAPAAGRPDDQLRDDLLSALLNLGYQRAAAEKAIDKVLKASPDAGLRAGAARRRCRSMMKGA